MKKELKNIANIQTGLFTQPVADGDLVYLQAKHFDENGQLRISLHPNLKADSITSKHLLKAGDVLFAAKGTKNFATLFESHNPSAVASTSFFVIRLHGESIFPEFLTWFLNNHETQRVLKDQALGTSLPSISKAVLESLEIPIPSLEKQKAIIEIAKLRNSEKNILEQIQLLREKQIQQQIIDSIK